MANQVKGVLYLQKNQLQVSLDNRADVLAFPFPQTAIDNMEVVNETDLCTQLSAWVKTQAIGNADLVYIISSELIFDKVFPKEKESEIPNYTDAIPFEHVSTRVLPSEKETRVLATNADLYCEIESALHDFGFSRILTVPDVALGAPIQEFNSSVARLVETKLELLKQYAFVESAPTETEALEVPASPTEAPKKNSSLKFLLPVFAILIIVLIVVAVKQLGPQPASPKPIPSVVNTTLAPTTVISPSSIVASSSSTLAPQDINVEIIHTTTYASAAAQLKGNLSTLGFKSITITPSTITVAKPNVLFSQAIPTSLQTQVVDTMKTIDQDITIQTTTTNDPLITITLGKQS